MDEQRVIDLMRGFFAEMQTKLVSEVVKSLTETHDSVSESSSEKETIVSIPVGDESPSSEKPEGRQILLKNGDAILVPFDCETLYRESKVAEDKLIKKIALTSKEVDAFIDKSDILAWFKKSYVPYYRYGGQLSLIHMIDASLVLRIHTLLGSKLEWHSASPQAIMDDVFVCSWKIQHSANAYHESLKAILCSSKLEDIRFEFNAIDFRASCEALLKLNSVKWSHSVGISILNQVKEHRLVKHLKEKLDSFHSLEEFWSEYSDRVAQLESAAKVLDIKHVSKHAGKDGKDAKEFKESSFQSTYECPICKGPHYAVNREGTKVTCPEVDKNPAQYKAKATEVLAARAKAFQEKSAKSAAATAAKKSGGAKAVSTEVDPPASSTGTLSEQLFSPAPVVTLELLQGETVVPISACLDGGSVSNIVSLDLYLNHFSTVPLQSCPELVSLYSSTGEALQIMGILIVPCVGFQLLSGVRYSRSDCLLQFFVCSNASDMLLNNYTIDNVLKCDTSMMQAIKESSCHYHGAKVNLVARGIKCPELSDEVFNALASLHNAADGHVGAGRLYAQVHRKFPALRVTNKMCRTFIHLCPRCQKDTKGISYSALNYVIKDTMYEFLFADTLELRVRGVVYYILVLLHYASRFCILTRLKGKKAKHIAKALITANSYLPFRHVVLQTDQGTEYLNSVNNILLKALVAKRFQVTNKGSHQENAIVERVLLEVRRFFDPIIVELSESLPQLDPVEGWDEEDTLDIALQMAGYLLNHLETHRGPSPMTLLMPLFSDHRDAMLSLPEYVKNNADFINALYDMQLGLLNAVDRMDKVAQEAHLSKNSELSLIPAPEQSLVLLEVGYSRTTPRFVGPYMVVACEEQMVTLQALTSSEKYRVHRSRVKPYVDDPRHFPPEVVAARDYQESIVFDILAHRFVDNDASHNVVSNMEFQVQFSRVTQWLPYAEVKHLRLLDDYAFQAGLSWLVRSSPKPATVAPKSLDTARTHVHKARVRQAAPDAFASKLPPKSKLGRKGKVSLVWSPIPFDSAVDLNLDSDGYALGMFTPYTPEQVVDMLQIGDPSMQESIVKIALERCAVWSASPTVVNLPPIEFATISSTRNMYVPSRPIHNPLARDACKHILDELEAFQIIEPIPVGKDNYKVNVPINMVKDKVLDDGTIVWRLVLDNRIVNDNLIKLQFPNSISMEHIWQGAVGKKYIATLDAPKAFYGIQVAEGSRYLSSFLHPIKQQRYWFTRLVMGTTNSPAIQQQFFLQTLQTFPCWIDDVVVACDDQQEFLFRLDTLLSIAIRFNFKFNLQKCKFVFDPAIILGRYVGSMGMRPLPKHVLNVEQFQVPKTIKQLQHFLGCGNWLRNFIMDYGVLAAPLHQKVAQATAAAGKFSWDPVEIVAFERLRLAIVNHESLVPFDPARPIYVASDACDTGYGGVVYHLAPDNVTKDLVSMVSGGFSKTQLKWNTTEKEAFAFYTTIASHSMFLAGRHFTIFTDHQALTYLVESVNAKVQRWKLALQEYQFEVTHLPGERNIEPDSLSRLVHFMGQ